jgi:hypothetical protein
MAEFDPLAHRARARHGLGPWCLLVGLVLLVDLVSYLPGLYISRSAIGPDTEGNSVKDG